MKRGNTAAASTYTGPLGELLVDTGLQTIRIQDGVTAGGWLLGGGAVDLSGVNANIAALSARITFSNTAITSANTSMKGYVDSQITATQGQITTANTGVVSYVNTLTSALRANITAANLAIVSTNSAITTANTSMKNYVDAQVATKTTASYVNSSISTAVNNLINSAPGTLDTLGEIAANLANQGSAVGAIVNSITNTNANVTAANLIITSLRANATTQQTQIDSLLANVGVVNTGDLRFIDNAMYNLGGVIVENADLSNPATAAVILPANGSSDTLQVNNDGQVSISASGKYWTFNTDGTLVLPNGSALDFGSSHKFSTKQSLTTSIDLRDHTSRGFYTDATGVKIQSNNYSWTFGIDGKLTIPDRILTPYGVLRESTLDSGLSIDSLQGITITSNGLASKWYFGTNGQITTPQGGAIGDTYSDGNGIGLSAGPNEGDYAVINSHTGAQYVEANETAVYIGTNYPDTNTLWTFNRDGSLQFPDSTVQTTAWTGNVDSVDAHINFSASAVGHNPGNGTITFADGTLQNTAWTDVAAQDFPPNRGIWYNTNDGRTYLKYNDAWVDANPTVAPAPSYYLGNLTVDGEVVNFTYGNLTIDDTGTLLVNGSQVNGSGGSGTYGNVDVAAYLAIYGGNVLASNIQSSTGTLTLSANTAEPESAWTISNDMFGPGSSVLTSPMGDAQHFGALAFQGNTGVAELAWVGPIGSPFDNSMILATSGNVTLEAGFSQMWKFGTDGNLILPVGGNINYANGQSILNGISTATRWDAIPAEAGCPIYAELTPDHFNAYTQKSHLELDNTGDWYVGSGWNGSFVNGIGYDVNVTSFNGNVTVQSGINQWTFSNDGTFTAPGNVYVTGNLIIQGNTYQEDRELFVSAAGEAIEFANGGNIFAPAGLGNVVVSTNNSEYNWTFGTDGEMYLPTGGRLGVAGKGWTGLDGGNGQPVSLTSLYSSGMYSGCFTINPGSGATISTYGDGTGQTGYWNFANDSATTMPGFYFNPNNSDSANPYLQVSNNLNLSTSGGDYTWRLGNDGNITLPNAVNPAINYYGNNRNILSTAVSVGFNPPSHTDRDLWYSTEDGRLYIYTESTWVDANPTVAPLASYYLGNLTVDNDTIDFPNGTLKVDTTGTSVLGNIMVQYDSPYWVIGTSNDGGQTSYGPQGMRINPGIESNADIQLPNDADAATTSVRISNYNNTGNVEIQAHSSAWKFGFDGNLTLPTTGNINYANGQSILSGITAGSTYSNVNVAAYIADSITTGNVLGNGTDPNVYIETVLSGNTSVWTFGTNGILTLPANTAIIQGAGTDSNVNVIASDGTTTAQWTFEKTGRLEAPGQINIVSSDTTDGGAGYAGLIKFTNNNVGASNNHKSLRLSDGGNLQIINSGYSATLLDLSDTGTLTVGGELIVNGAIVNSTSPATGSGDVAYPTALDLTKTVNKLSDNTGSYYTLADGVEGQTMYLVRQRTVTDYSYSSIHVLVANAYYGINTLTNQNLYFGSGQDLITLVFTDGAWQQSGGSWD